MHVTGPPDPDPGLPPDEWPIGRLLATVARMLHSSFDADLAAVQLNHAGFITLHVLRSGPLSQADLAHRCRVTAQTMSRTVERLERSGYVTRHRDALDARRQLVAATPAGLEVYRTAPGRDSARALDQLADPVAFRAELLRLIEHLREHRR